MRQPPGNQPPETSNHMADRLQYDHAMRCPECKALNEPAAAACTTCGLLLLNAAPQRRAEDLAVKRRRLSDAPTIECEFCSGTIASKAVRCRHCGEVVDEEFYRERASRLRSRINYASWVMYLF